MLDYLKKFNDLPKELRDKISSASVMAVISELEAKHQIDLAAIVMRVMVKQISPQNLESYFVNQHLLKAEAARDLATEMISRVFRGVGKYLDINNDAIINKLVKIETGSKAAAASNVLFERQAAVIATAQPSVDDYDLDDLIKEACLTFPGESLNSRFKNIILTYFKGIRTKIDTRAVLKKEFALGGVNLGEDEIDRIFRISDRRLRQHHSLMIMPTKPLKKLDRIISQSEHVGGEEYDLKKSLAAKKIDNGPRPLPAAPIRVPELVNRSVTTLDTGHELKAALSQLDTSHELVSHSFLDMSHELNAPVSADLRHRLPAAKPLLDTSHKLNTPAALVAVSSLVTEHSLPLIKKQAPVILVGSKNLNIKQEKPESLAVNRSLPPSPKYSVNKQKFLSSAIKKPQDSTAKPAPAIPVVSEPSVRPLASTDKKVIATTNKIVPVVMAEKKNISTLVNPISAITSERPKSSLAASRATTIPGSGFGMHDIKPIPKVMGPLEELRFLDLVNFRRLGKTPEESIQKILNKIKLLEKDGYDRMVAGVKSWRQSPVNRLYLRLGQEAVIKGKSFKEIVELYQQKSQNSLNMSEIEAIVSLNGKLIF